MSPDASDPVRTFVTRWKNSGLTERASAQSHFNDLCDLLGVPRPTDQRETDSSYGFEARTELAGSAANCHTIYIDDLLGNTIDGLR